MDHIHLNIDNKLKIPQIINPIDLLKELELSNLFNDQDLNIIIKIRN